MSTWSASVVILWKGTRSSGGVLLCNIAVVRCYSVEFANFFNENALTLDGHV